MYVGQAGIRDNEQSILDRLNEHAWLGNDPAKYIDKWTDIVVVTNEKGAWGATELDAIEHIFWSLIPVGNRLNSQKPTCTGADLGLFTNAVSQIKEYLDYLEFTTFKEKTTQNIIDDVKEVAESKSDIPIDLDHGTSRIPNITTPLKVINQMLDLLPEEIWNDKTVFLDPACKDGGYLKAIHDRLVKRPELIQKYGSERALSIHILSTQLYGIALNQNSRAVTVDKLDGFGYNIRVIPNYISILKYINGIRKKDKNIDTEKLTKDIINKEFNKDMAIDVVIGNPPYQDADGRSSVYPDFIGNAIDIGNTVCMITRDNWISGMAFEDMRKQFLNNGSIKEIRHYPIVGELFSGIGVAVAYFLWERANDDDEKSEYANYIRIESGEVISNRRVNIKRILTSEIGASVVDKVGVDGEWTTKYNTRSYPFMDQRKRYALDTSKESSLEYNVAVLADKECVEYTSISNFRCIDDVKSYKVICGVKTNEARLQSPGLVLTNIKALPPMVVNSETWSLIATFNNKDETINCKKYIQTKFVRFLTNQTVNVMSTVTKNTFRFVPLQDFTSNSDIDWSQPLSGIDMQLYKKYNLSNDEIDYIEKTMKSSDDSYNVSKMKITNEDIQANYINKMINNQ